MPHALRPKRPSADIRATARAYGAAVAAGAARRHRAVIGALCVAVVVAGGTGGAWLARSGLVRGSAEGTGAETARLRPGDVQFAQVLEPALGDTDANPARAPTGSPRIARAETRLAAVARFYDDAPAGAAKSGAQRPEPSAAGAASRMNLPSLSGVERGASSAPLWQRNAASVADNGNGPMIAIVIDDVGLNRPLAYKSIALPAPVTLAFMTYAEDLDTMAAAARSAGHELLVHVPMLPRSRRYDPGPNVLDASLPAAEVRRRLKWGLGRFDGFVGINNHMGSRFTTSPEGMSSVMRELRARGLLFLDSLTTASSVGPEAAQQAGVPYAVRDIFFDNTPDDAASVRAQLAKLETIARRRGYAVGIGHSRRGSLEVLAKWLPEARRRGFTLVPISTIIRTRAGITQAAADPVN